MAELKLFGSARSAGTKVQTKFGEVVIEDFSVEEARKLDVVFVSVSGDFSLEHCEKMAEGEDGCVVIDNSSAFRMKEGFALCVPEINADAAKKSSKKVIANPNCTTAIGIMALWPLHQKYGLKKVLMSTYQAASGAGQEGMDELFNGAKMVTSGEKPVADNKIFAYPLAFNLIPHIDVFQDNLYTKEEMKVTWECQKIMDLPDLPVSCTAVRIPTLRAHAETIVVETEKPINPDEVGARGACGCVKQTRCRTQVGGGRASTASMCKCCRALASPRPQAAGTVRGAASSASIVSMQLRRGLASQILSRGSCAFKILRDVVTKWRRGPRERQGDGSGCCFQLVVFLLSATHV